jgi:large subunit ribosomal protein L22
MAQIETKKTPVAKVKVSTSKVTAKISAKKVEAVKAEIPQSGIVPVIKIAKYTNKNLKVSPRKLRLVANNVKNLKPSDVVTRLKFTNSNATRLLAKCVEDAIASAVHNYNLLPQTLKFTDFRVDEGLKIKRMDKSHGSRFARGIIQKRHSRLIIVLSGTIAS